jgi:hypothetical protein
MSNNQSVPTIPSIMQALAEDRTRIRIMEALVGGVGGGIQFGGAGQIYGDRNSGDYLDITTDDYDGTIDGSVQILSQGIGGHIRVTTEASSIFITAPTGEGQGVYIEGGQIVMTAPDSGVQVNGGFFTTAGSAADDVGFILFGTGSTSLVTFYDGSAQPIMEIRADGTIHGRAAVGAITWDL